MNYWSSNKMAGRVNKPFLSVFILNIHVCIVLGALSDQKLMLKIDRLDICYRSPDSPTHVNYHIIKYTRDIGYSLDVDIDVLRDVDSDKIWGLLRVERCASREALDTCEKFAELKPPIHICHFLKIKGMGIDKVIASFNPPPKCPFRKGKFTGKNVIFNPDLFTMYPTTGFYWKIRGDAGEGDRHYFSVCFEGAIVPSRGQKSYNISLT